MVAQMLGYLSLVALLCMVGVSLLILPPTSRCRQNFDYVLASHPDIDETKKKPGKTGL
jgi:hypothetical protein